MLRLGPALLALVVALTPVAIASADLSASDPSISARRVEEPSPMREGTSTPDQEPTPGDEDPDPEESEQDADPKHAFWGGLRWQSPRARLAEPSAFTRAGLGPRPGHGFPLMRPPRA